MRSRVFSSRGALGDSLLMLLMITLFVVVSSTIVVVHAAYSGSGYDVRSYQAETLRGLIAECVTLRGIASVTEDIYTSCGLSEVSFEDNLGVKICAGLSVEECSLSKTPGLVAVGSNFQVCALEGSLNPDFPRCSVSIVASGGESFVIMTYSNKKSWRVNG